MAERDGVEEAVRRSLSLLTVDQVCELLQVKKDWLYEQTAADRFPHIKLGRHLRFRPADVQEFLKAQTRGN